MKEFAERIRNLRGELGFYSQQEMADAIGVSRNMLALVESSNREPSRELLISIVSYCNNNNIPLNANWLLTGIGNPMLSSDSISSSGNEIIGTQGKDLYVFNTKGWELVGSGELIDIPVLGEIACGTPNNFQEDEPLGVLRINLPNHRNYFCFKVRGDSMMPDIKPGDFVIIDRIRDWENAQRKIGAVLIDYEATLKRVDYDVSGNLIVLTPINDSHQPIIVDPRTNNVQLLGVLVYIVHSKRDDFKG